tara:strand:+ start:4571 stop:5554 length:984 start_codon:yes stop_codon:yes gene_type:complete
MSIPILVEDYYGHAGKWIYDGYAKAFEAVGREVIRYHTPAQVIDAEIKLEGKPFQIFVKPNQGKGSELQLRAKQYDLMITDWHIESWNAEYIINARRVYLYVQPTSFPDPWGRHRNFVSVRKEDPDAIEFINSLDNVIKWAFSEITPEYYSDWGTVHQVPLAFDSISYKHLEDDRYKFDVCFVGGLADNGFGEKEKIMMKHFAEIKKLGLNCGIFINKGLTHEQENKVLYNSKIAINIHDAYQRTLGLDVNERTFKSLGLTGFLISDYVRTMESLLPEVPLASTPEEMKDLILKYIDMDLSEIKDKNRKNILENHTYISRVKLLESL